jgi:hypothetical protein
MAFRQLVCGSCGYEIDKGAIMLPASMEISVLSERNMLPGRLVYRVICPYCNKDVLNFSLNTLTPPVKRSKESCGVTSGVTIGVNAQNI